MTVIDSLNVVIRGHGTPLLMIHGFTVDHRILMPFENVFDTSEATSGWQRIYLDLPGFGATPARADVASADAMGELVDGVAAELFADSEFAVFGNSFGGQLARDLAVRRPQQVIGLGLLVPLVAPPGARTLPPRTVLHRDEKFLASLPDVERHEYEDIAVIQGADNHGRWASAVRPGVAAHDRAAAQRLREDYMLSVTPESRLHGPLDVPGLLILGRQDSDVGWTDQLELLKYYPRMTTAILDGAGHNAHLDRPGETSALFVDWLGRIRSGY